MRVGRRCIHNHLAGACHSTPTTASAPQEAPGEGVGLQVDENGISEGMAEFTSTIAAVGGTRGWGRRRGDLARGHAPSWLRLWPGGAGVEGPGTGGGGQLKRGRRARPRLRMTPAPPCAAPPPPQLTSLECLCGTLRLDELGPVCSRRLVPGLTRLTRLTLYRRGGGRGQGPALQSRV